MPRSPSPGIMECCISRTACLPIQILGAIPADRLWVLSLVSRLVWSGLCPFICPFHPGIFTLQCNCLIHTLKLVGALCSLSDAYGDRVLACASRNVGVLASLSGFPRPFLRLSLFRVIWALGPSGNSRWARRRCPACGLSGFHFLAHDAEDVLYVYALVPI